MLDPHPSTHHRRHLHSHSFGDFCYGQYWSRESNERVTRHDSRILFAQMQPWVRLFGGASLLDCGLGYGEWEERKWILHPYFPNIFNQGRPRRC